MSEVLVVDMERALTLARQIQSLEPDLREAKAIFDRCSELHDELGRMLDNYQTKRGGSFKVNVGELELDVNRPKGGYKFYRDYEIIITRKQPAGADASTSQS